MFFCVVIYRPGGYDFVNPQGERTAFQSEAAMFYNVDDAAGFFNCLQDMEWFDMAKLVTIQGG